MILSRRCHLSGRQRRTATQPRCRSALARAAAHVSGLQHTSAGARASGLPESAGKGRVEVVAMRAADVLEVQLSRPRCGRAQRDRRGQVKSTDSEPLRSNRQARGQTGTTPTKVQKAERSQIDNVPPRSLSGRRRLHRRGRQRVVAPCVAAAGPEGGLLIGWQSERALGPQRRCAARSAAPVLTQTVRTLCRGGWSGGC